MAHRGIFLTSLTLSFLALIIQVQIPLLVEGAIDKSLSGGHPTALGHYVAWILILGVVRLVMGYISQLYLFETAYAIEYDLRIDHVRAPDAACRSRSTTGSSPVSSSPGPTPTSARCRCTSPSHRPSSCSAAWRWSPSPTCCRSTCGLTFVAMATMPFVFMVGVKMRRDMFPVSWLIQARLADVATIVDENINGVRVVKSFAAEDAQMHTLAGAAERVQWANIKDADIRAKWSPTARKPAPARRGPRPALRRAASSSTAIRTVGDLVAFNFYILMLQPPFRMLGIIIMMGQRASASAERIYEVLDEQPDIVDRPGAVDLVECSGDVRFDDVTFDYANGTPVLSTVRPAPAAGRDGRPRRADRERQVDRRRGWSPASTT